MIFWFLWLAIASLFTASEAEAGNSTIRGEGGSVNIPGLSNGVCNDECREWIDNEFVEPRALPNWTTVYFHAQDGDDDNLGTKEHPLQSAELIEDILNTGQVTVYWDGDYNEDGSGEAMETWDGWDLDIPDCDEPFCAALLATDPDDVPTLDCSVDTTLTGDVNSGLQPIRIEGRMIVGRAEFQHCPPEPKDATDSAAFHQGIDVLGSDENVVAFLGTSTIDFAGGHVHGIRGSDGWTIQVGVHMRARDLAAFDEDCSTAGDVDPSECADQDTHALALCDDENDPHNTCTADSGAGDSESRGKPHIFETSQDFMILGGIYEIGNTQYDEVSGNIMKCILSDAQGSFIHIVDGATCIGPPRFDALANPQPGAGGAFSTLFASGGNTLNVYLSRFTAGIWPSNMRESFGFRAGIRDNSPNGSTMNMRLYQNTLGGVVSGIQGQNPNTGDSRMLWGRCNQFDEMIQSSLGPAEVMHLSNPLDGTYTLDFDGSNSYDIDDGVSESGSANPRTFLFNSPGTGAYDGAADVDQSDPGGDGSTGWNVIGDFFGATEGSSEGPLESGGDGTDGNSYGTLESQLISQESLREGCTETFDIAIPSEIQPHLEVLFGERITTIRRGTHWKGIGAR